jgi:hemerythrin superfamily protein
VSTPPARHRGLLPSTDLSIKESAIMTQQPELFRILHQQHQEVDAILTQLADTDDVELRAKLLPVLEQQLLSHAKAEEDTFYKELERAGEKGEAKHAKHEHRDIEAALTELMTLSPDDGGFDAAVRNVTKTVKHHVEEEESDVFEAAQESLDTATLDRLAEEFMESRRQKLEALGGTDDGYSELTRDQLLAEARERDLPGRSTMTRDQLISILRASE